MNFRYENFKCALGLATADFYSFIIVNYFVQIKSEDCQIRCAVASCSKIIHK